MRYVIDIAPDGFRAWRNVTSSDTDVVRGELFVESRSTLDFQRMVNEMFDTNGPSGFEFRLVKKEGK